MFEKKPWSRQKDYTTPTGVITCLHSISTLADALGRTTQTIRKWEIAGVIPKTPFTDKVGNRMYTIGQIKAIVKSAERSNITAGKKLAGLKFAERNADLFKELSDHYLKEINPKLTMNERD